MSVRQSQLGAAVSEVLGILHRAGSVRITAEVAGKTVEIRLASDQAERASSPARADKRAVARPAARFGSLPSERDVLLFVQSQPKGRNLEEIAMRFGVRPRTKLKSVLDRLLRHKDLIRAGRQFRWSKAVVKRGRRPGSAIELKRAVGGR